MTDLQLELTRLIGKKELTFGCLAETKEMKIFLYRLIAKVYFPGDTNENRWGVINMHNNSLMQQTIPQELLEVIGHPATLSDLHRWLENENPYRRFSQDIATIKVLREDGCFFVIPYNSSKDLLDQDEETLKQIIDLIKSDEKC